MTARIAFIGGGNMASSLIGGLLANGANPSNITASDPNTEQQQNLKQQFSVNVTGDNNQAIAQSDVIVLAVKPQLMAVVCQAIAEAGNDLNSKLFVSIAAGVSVKRLKGLLGEQVAIVRTMPNTPALVGRGMTGLFAPADVSKEQIASAEQLMKAVGETCWVANEDDINHIIAAAGSAPAYFFLFMEAMQQQAEQLGFSPEQARSLIQQSALGSAELVAANPDLDLATLRANVTSKGGTTAEAIRVFEEQGLRKVVANAMDAAVERGREMESLF
ncbi:pyrroline-5-carboxylate reductase [Agarivorans sp. B2Z047]|uniref:pyrroline-5-carboxylate reductase n=1 Tax=Agarivorans sp. B2Z047 TaxID=2652721 RepID=UPI00128B240C|nr:pyrroline-5-carboxylate reductase [Agarivorans sp. B2Z047]MPW30717.1 pyrroline-5-carboxylate reductase [Agarivorans sp. B2Z047]UQN42061.1 pyrroline-5-carboxylate reductase [Agarivorans sp. B2Z047]